MMTLKLEKLLEELRGGLAGLAPEAAARALEYYRDYIDDALEAGRNEDEILERLGRPEDIIALVRAENSLNSAESAPGPLRLIGARKSVLSSMASSAAKVSLVMGAAIPYTLALGFYIFAVASYLGALLSVAILAYGIAQTAPVYVWERIGTAGTAALSAAILVALGLGLWVAANGITRYTLRVLRRGLRKNGGPDMPPRAGRSGGRIRGTLLVCSGAAVVGLVLLIPSGMAFRYFSIWNSQRPDRITNRAWSYSPGEIQAIQITTMNARIVLKTAEAGSDTISVIYEEPDWMKASSTVIDHRLVFAEESRNRLPFIGFISRHEGMQIVTVEVPRGYLANEAVAQSNGGHISIDLRARSILAKTFSGTIRFNNRGGSYAIQASTRNGRITVKGKQLDSRVYAPGHGAAFKADIFSTDGMIEIE